ncbi:MAG: hypothetical protein HHJ17_17780 [Rhodoferax sp.]|uniref:hypothetical protein n=1 Tax=Rhodoferax sp. TaxID=50421 RepID=UPI0017FF2007|nr:hypothetical protein [Rhodoferax sp.]NMM15371.1 hypothetical protein [Rhodoferax sp.]
MFESKDRRRAHIMRQLNANGVTVVDLPGGSVRLYGQGNSITTSDVLYLRETEVNRLCGKMTA